MYLGKEISHFPSIKYPLNRKALAEFPSYAPTFFVLSRLVSIGLFLSLFRLDKGIGFLHANESLASTFDTCTSERNEDRGFLHASLSLAASFDTCTSERKEA